MLDNDNRSKMQRYDKINDILHKKLEREYYRKMQELFLVKKMDDGFHKYSLGNENETYIRYITDEELWKIIKLAIDILEEMKVINNSGVDRKGLERIYEEVRSKEENEYLQKLYAWERIKTDEMRRIIREIDKVARVGGAWALLIANPSLNIIAYGVYDKLVDDFDNEEWYWLCGFYLTQAIMRMYGNEK